MMERKREKLAVVLLSGGVDSATTLAIAIHQGFSCHALSFDYGQRHRFELSSAHKIARSLGAVEHRIIKIDLTGSSGFGKSALTDQIDVPKDREGLQLGRSTREGAFGEDKAEIPITYVPARNTIFLSFALAYCEVIGAFDIFIGVNAVDFSGYPDCRGEYIEAFEKLANLATAAAITGKGKFRIHAPLLEMSKAEIIRKGVSLGVDFSLTHSCYDPAPDGTACGKCDACRIRLAGFAQAGLKDPIRYQPH